MIVPFAHYLIIDSESIGNSGTSWDQPKNYNAYRETFRFIATQTWKKVGISRTSINKIEKGKTIPRLKTDNDIANALGVCMYQIFDLDGEETYKCHSRNCCQELYGYIQ